MTAHPDWCDKRDDPLALALWRSDRPALLDVWCGRQRHRLGKVFDVPGLGRRLCLPGFTIKARYLELGSQDHGNNDAHLHAWMYDLADETDDEMLISWCRCGTWSISRHQVVESLSRPAPQGQTRRVYAAYTIAPSDVPK